VTERPLSDAEPPAGFHAPLRSHGEKHQIDIWVSRRVTGDVNGWFISAGFIRRLR
jgi:hypothetical protein